MFLSSQKLQILATENKFQEKITSDNNYKPDRR